MVIEEQITHFVDSDGQIFNIMFKYILWKRNESHAGVHNSAICK